MIREIEHKALSGFLMLFVLLAVLVGLSWMIVATIRDLGELGSSVGRVWWLVGLILAWAADLVMLAGLFTIAPNEGKVLQLFGRYVGTAKEPGLRWANPFLTKKRVSLRVRNFETGKLKVNDKRGNPIEFASVVVWKVVDTAEAVFMVDDFKHYVHVQSEAAGRALATGYPYDVFDEGEVSLVSHTAEISDKLKVEIQDRLDKAGVEVIEARISHLAYSPEIASAMLQRQQAAAVIAARKKIVQGAVGMVEDALDQLSAQRIVELDDERRAQMVSNLLVVLTSESRPQPVLNAGSVY
ncbi:MAG TPA: SPFH domain-containing protein [Acidobacteriota bacterium]|nr:SPFH domain-containing protein [Acidobacteriota bacterium]